MATEKTEICLSIIVTVVSGRDSMRRCLQDLCAQADFQTMEIIVPFDKWSREIGELKEEFGQVLFCFIENLGRAKTENISAHQHRLYDRRRAIGLQIARGKLIAMTEDHARPAANWCAELLKTQRQPFAVIGGAIENGIDKPLNWAWYYCDYGRYGRPFADEFREYISDVNIVYKRDALEAVREIWELEYRETVLHWAIQKRGGELFLNHRLAVYEERPPMKLSAAMRERLEWGRVFAETRVLTRNGQARLLYAAKTFFLPPVLLQRVIRNMLRQRRSFRQMITAAPLALLLLTAWSIGELTGYLSGSPKEQSQLLSSIPNVSISE
jgi:hypothetical protein